DAGRRQGPGRARVASPRQLAPLWTLWQGSRGFEAAYFSVAFAPSRCRSSVVEHSLGKGEVVSSILTGSTSDSHSAASWQDVAIRRRESLAEMEYARALLGGHLRKLNTTVLLSTGLLDGDQLSFEGCQFDGRIAASQQE